MMQESPNERIMLSAQYIRSRHCNRLKRLIAGLTVPSYSVKSNYLCNVTSEGH